jgi:hypothetical protein
MDIIYGFYWVGNDVPEKVAAQNDKAAFKNAGIGHGALRALDHYKPLPSTSVVQMAKELNLDLTEMLLMVNGVMGRPRLGDGLLLSRDSNEPCDWVMTTDDAQTFMARVREHQNKATA